MSKYIFGYTFLVLPVALILGYNLTYFMFSVAPQENANRVKDTVLAICNHSQVTNDYNDCYIAQSSSNTEYLCKSNACWVEDKK